MSILFNSFLAGLLCIHGVNAVGTAFGYGTGTTGGGSAAAAVPTSTSQLITWLGDSTARTILLDKIFDFTDTEGTVSGAGCVPWTCTPNPQLAINANNWCPSTAATITATYKKAGVSGIIVGSNKTLLGKGSAGGILAHNLAYCSKGKGLRIVGSKNIIIQNIRISDLNAQYVWGGDAIAIDGGSNIWASHLQHSTQSHCCIKNIGRQMLVTGYGSVQGLTVSDNVFEGSGTYSATCNGRHYWAILFTGASDTITFARNYVYMTSGRGPKVGGTSGYSQLLHSYNNYYVSVAGHALDAGVGGMVIMEGNYFNTVTTPSVDGSEGAVYAPIDSSHAAQCSTYIGRSCYANSLLSSGTLNRNDIGAVPYFSSASVVKSASIMAASSVGAYVQANAGLGKVN
ncbi:pectin lyase-like protein [Ceratobasidium sp. AG-I]|nr:pectin lyase-like protein [Ceratobasidium sp. AG-I]